MRNSYVTLTNWLLSVKVTQMHCTLKQWAMCMSVTMIIQKGETLIQILGIKQFYHSAHFMVNSFTCWVYELKYSLSRQGSFTYFQTNRLLVISQPECPDQFQWPSVHMFLGCCTQDDVEVSLHYSQDIFISHQGAALCCRCVSTLHLVDTYNHRFKIQCNCGEMKGKIIFASRPDMYRNERILQI